MSANKIQHILTFLFYLVLAVLVGIWIYKSKWLEVFVFCSTMGILHVYSWYNKHEQQEKEGRNRKVEKESDSQQLVD